MPITKMTQPIVKQINADIKAALESVADKHGVKISLGKHRYGDTEYTVPVTVKVRQTAAGKTPEQVQFEQYAPLFDLSPDDFGREFVSGGQTYRVIGVKPRGIKNTIALLRLSDGARCHSPHEPVKKSLASSPAK